jgi:hypothetical protein
MRNNLGSLGVFATAFCTAFVKAKYVAKTPASE